MTADRDPLDSEISASVTVTDTGFEAKLKSRTTSAFDRLFGSVFEYVGLKIEKPNSRERAVMDAERAAIEAAGKSLISRIESEHDYADRMIEIHLKGISRKQRNKDAIGKIAYEEMKQSPPPDAASMKGASDDLDEDWLNRFEQIAETASTERMQQLFGKILSGEIRKPGAFSLTTLRVASELSQRTAEIFHELAGVRVGDAITEYDEERHFTKCLELEVAGLVNFDRNGIMKKLVSTDLKTVRLSGDEIYAIFEIKNSEKEFRYSMILLTAVGLELAELIPNDELRAIKTIIERGKHRITTAKLFKITAHKGEDLVIDEKPFETIQFDILQ